MTDVRVVSFNVNQFSKPGNEAADLIVRMAHADVVLIQESVRIDLAAFVTTQPDWAAFQVRTGDNDGHANTAVLYRKTLGPVQDTVDLFVGVTKGTRRRFLAAVKLGGVWYGALHLFPRRFHSGIPGQLRRTGSWLRTHPGPVVLGLDKNQAKPAALEHATALDWHGIDIDGLLTNLALKGLAEFPKGFSDHPGVHAVVTAPSQEVPVTVPPKSGLDTIRDLLRQALAWATAHGKKGRARKERAALKALRKARPPKGTPAPTPDPVPAEGFPAITAARAQSHNGPQFGLGECMMRVRMCYGIPSGGDFDGDGDADAEDGWVRSTHKHRTTDPASIPRGYPIFWLGGSHDNGHIAISAGNGRCWSSDIVRTGFFDYVDITEIHDHWGLTLVGYTGDLNGVLIDPNHTGA